MSQAFHDYKHTKELIHIKYTQNVSLGKRLDYIYKEARLVPVTQCERDRPTIYKWTDEE